MRPEDSAKKVRRSRDIDCGAVMHESARSLRKDQIGLEAPTLDSLCMLQSPRGLAASINGGFPPSKSRDAQ